MKIASSKTTFDYPFDFADRNKRTAHAGLIAEVKDIENGKSTTVGSDIPDNFMGRVGENYGIVGWEGVYRPYKVDPDSGTDYLPSFGKPTPNLTGVPTSQSLNTFQKGHDIDMVLQLEDGVYKNYMLKGAEAGAESGLVPLGFKGPMVLTGWGVDTNTFPVPNSGTYTKQYPANYLTKPQNWKSGPIDIRWDDSRKIWAGGSFTVKGVMTKSLTKVGPPPTGDPPNAKIRYWNENTDTHDDGPEIKVGAYLDKDLIANGTKFLASWDEDYGCYRIQEADC